MSHEILSAKLYELDREFGLLHGSIQLSETASREQLGQELARLRQKNEADRLAFQTKLKFSRSPMVGKLASSYETIPEPEGPTRAVTVPGRMSRFTSWSTSPSSCL